MITGMLFISFDNNRHCFIKKTNCALLCVCVCVSELDLHAVVGGIGEKVTLLGGRWEGPSLLEDTGAVQGEGRIVF